MLEIDMKNKIINKVVEKINPSFIIFYGSFAKGTVHESSDLDLAYFSFEKLSPYDRFILAGELARFVNQIGRASCRARVYVSGSCTSTTLIISDRISRKTQTR